MRKLFPTGYSAVGKSQSEFRELCETLARDLPAIMEECEADAIAVRGSSGLSVAFGIRMLADIPFIVCRKDGEMSHSDQISMAHGESMEVNAYIVLDDLISSGCTVDGIVRDLAGSECTGIVTYERCSPSKRMVRFDRSHRSIALFGYGYT